MEVLGTAIFADEGLALNHAEKHVAVGAIYRQRRGVPERADNGTDLGACDALRRILRRKERREIFFNQNICQTGNGITAAINNGFAGAEIAANGRQMGTMQQLFGVQTAISDCCCKQAANSADLKYTIASEECATRSASANNTRDIIDSQTRGIQTIMDKLCALELDGYKRENDQLRSQLNMAALRESQTAQNAFIQQGFSDEVDALYNRLNNCPVPSTPVYGRTPIFTCQQNSCGCGGAFAA